MPREMEELRAFIDKNLARVFIQLAKLRMLFKEKKDGSLRLCVNYRGLNGICVENMYVKPLRGVPLTGGVVSLATGTTAVDGGSSGSFQR